MVGRQPIVGLPGPDATDADIRLFDDMRAGGLMLYRRNFETPERFLAWSPASSRGLGAVSWSRPITRAAASSCSTRA